MASSRFESFYLTLGGLEVWADECLCNRCVSFLFTVGHHHSYSVVGHVSSILHSLEIRHIHSDQHLPTTAFQLLTTLPASPLAVHRRRPGNVSSHFRITPYRLLSLGSGPLASHFSHWAFTVAAVFGHLCPLPLPSPLLAASLPLLTASLPLLTASSLSSPPHPLTPLSRTSHVAPRSARARCSRYPSSWTSSNPNSPTSTSRPRTWNPPCPTPPP